MEKIHFLLKFGEREHIEEFVKGHLYFGNAKIYRGIEDQLKIKGQGDKLEASGKVFTQNMQMCDHDTREVLTECNRINMQIVFRFPAADPIPVFCLFAVCNEDCDLDDNGNYYIKLSDKTKATIKKHFPNADSVAIIRNPKLFLKEVEETIGYDVKHDMVHYYNIDKGYTTSKGKVAMDHNYSMYLMQDTPPTKDAHGNKTYVFKAKYIFRVLFCKDVYFKDEKEYRIILPNEKIKEGKVYNANLSEEFEIKTLEELFGE